MVLVYLEMNEVGVVWGQSWDMEVLFYFVFKGFEEILMFK